MSTLRYEFYKFFPLYLPIQESIRTMQLLSPVFDLIETGRLQASDSLDPCAYSAALGRFLGKSLAVNDLVFVRPTAVKRYPEIWDSELDVRSSFSDQLDFLHQRLEASKRPLDLKQLGQLTDELETEVNAALSKACGRYLGILGTRCTFALADLVESVNMMMQLAVGFALTRDTAWLDKLEPLLNPPCSPGFPAAPLGGVIPICSLQKPDEPETLYIFRCLEADLNHQR